MQSVAICKITHMARRSAVVTTAVSLALTAAVLTFAGPTAQSKLPQQSPINVTAESLRFDANLPKLNIAYSTHADIELRYVRKDEASPTGCTTRDHEETEEAEVPAGAGHVTLSGARYDLIQFHFHTPSEHKFQGQSAPLEMHLVHRSAAGRLLVVGVPLRVGASSTVDKVLAKLAPECGSNVHVGEIDLNTLLPHDRTTARYPGSLTTAPFSEDVQWFLMKDKTVTQATLSRFQHLFTSGNARAPQPLNGRTVTVDRGHI